MANTLYLLAAYDNSGRRYWRSPFVDLTRAPAPVGAYDPATLTIMASFPYGPPTDNLEGWWQASDLDLPNNAPVLKWPDALGNGVILSGDPTFGFASAPYLVKASANFAGQNAVYFQEQISVNVSRPSGFIVGTGAQSCYVVFRHSGAGAGVQGVFGFGSNNFPGSRIVGFVGGAAPNWSFSFDSFAGGVGAPLPAGTVVASFALANGATWNTADFRLNGVPQSTVGASGSLNIPPPCEQFEIGGFASDTGGYYRGEVAEVLCYAANHGATERDAVFDYLNQKYALSL